MKRILTTLCVVSTFFVSAQNVGIGTSTPAYKLDVNGTINADTLRLLGRQVITIALPSGIYRNLYVGDSAGSLNTTGYFCTYIGAGAGRFNTTGYRNSYVGGYAGYLNSTGHDNIAFGTSAGQNNLSSQNIFIGSGAGFSNSLGNNNTYIGNSASNANVNGFNNVSLGSLAGFNDNGNSNTFIGMNAGFTNNSGSSNTIIGAFADLASDNLVNAMAIGYQSSVSSNNSLVLGSISGVNGATASVNVGIGTSSPSSPLHVKSTASNIFSLDGGSSMYTAFSENGIYRGYIGSYAGNPEDVDFGTGAGNATGKLHLTIQATPKLTVDASGNVGIGNTSPSEKLDIVGNIKLSGEINRPATTGAANLVPIAYGNIASNGGINSGSGNFTALRFATGIYVITITGEAYQFQLYTTVVTPSISSPILVTTGSGSGQLQVFTFNPAGTATDSNFHFVVYKQ